MSNFFKELKIIELAGVLAGPGVGLFFAELGARVLKVENKNVGGDATRTWRLAGETPNGPSAYFSSVNYKKEYLFLDLTSAADREKLLEEIASADIVISNYSSRVAQKLGMDYPSLRAVNQELIYLQLDGFANSNRPAYDVVLQAETGWISMTGHPENPSKLPVALIDVLAGHQLKEGALLALIHRMKTGEGSLVHCNLEQASLTALANQATNYLMNGAVAEPIGTLHPNIAPYGDWFATSDGKRIVLAVGSDKQFEKLNTVLGLQLHGDKRFITNPDRLNHRAELREALIPAIAKFNLADLSQKLDAAGVPFGEIKSLDSVLESAAAKAMVRTEMQDGRETKRLSGNAFTAGFI